MPRKSNRLLAAAWILFTVSLLLPAADDMVGWRCALTCAAMITELAEWAGVYYFIFTFPNLLMLFSVWIVYWLNGKRRKTKWLNATALFCALYVLAFGIINWFSPGFDLKTGYFLWLASFWLLFMGLISLQRGMHLENTPPLQSGAMTA